MTALEPRRTTATIATELRHEAQAAEKDLRSAVAHAIRAGELLTEAKGQVAHGEWLPWIAANFPGSEDTAGRYMKLAANSARARNLPSIRAALKEITPSAPLKHPATPSQVSYLRSLSEQAGTEPPAEPISKARASKLIDQLRDGSTATAPAEMTTTVVTAPWLAKLRKLIEEVEQAELTAPDIAAAQPLAGRLARAVGLASTTAPGRLPAPEWTDDELQALVDGERAS